MTKDDKTKSEAETASDVNFIDALNDLVENVPHRKGAKKYSLLLLIRSYYKKDDDLYKITSIPLDDLIKEIYFPDKKTDTILPQQIKDKRKGFSSLKSSLNKNLRTMAEEGSNPLGIIVGKSNTFNVSHAVELERASESVEKDLSSELSDILSNAGVELKGDMAEKLKKVIHNEFVSHKKGIEKIEKKMATEKANKQLKRELKELSSETTLLKKELNDLKESIPSRETGSVDTSIKEKMDKEIIEDIEKTIASSIQTGIESDVKALTERDRDLADKEKMLSGKEREILKLQRELSEKDIAFREEISKERERVEERFRAEREPLQKNIEELTVAQQKLAEEKDRLLDEQIKTRDDYDTALEGLHKEKAEQEKAGQKDWNKQTSTMANLLKNEKEFQKERDYQRRGFAKKEENIQNMAAEQIMASMEINEARTALEKEKEELRQELKKKFDKEKERLSKKMEEDLEIIKKEQNQILKEKEELSKEQKAIGEKEKLMAAEIEKIVSRKVADREAKLADKEKRLEQLKKNLEMEEKLLLEEKTKLVDQIKSGLGGKTSLLKLKELVKNQEKMLSTKQSIREGEETLRRKMAEEIKSEREAAMEEIEQRKEALRKEEKRLDELRDELNKKAYKCNEDKNKAIKELIEKYGNMIARKEEEFNEKETECSGKIMELNNREADILKKQEALSKSEREQTLQVDEKEAEVFKMMEQHFAEKEKLINAAKNLSRKSALLEENYNNKIKQVKKVYQEKFELLEKKSADISDKETKYKEDEMAAMEKAKKINEEYSVQPGPKKEELEMKETEMMERETALDSKREELQKARQEFEKTRTQSLKEYENKIAGIGKEVNERVQGSIEKLIEKMGINKGEFAAAFSEKPETFVEDGKQEKPHQKKPMPDMQQDMMPDDQFFKDIEKKLTSTLAADIGKNVKALTEKDQELEQKEKILTEKENKILQLQKEMSEKEMAFKEELKKEKESLESRFQEEKDILQKNVDGLIGERTALTKERDEILDESIKSQDRLDKELERLRKENVEGVKTNQQEWKDLTRTMTTLMKEEKEFHGERDYQRRGFSKKEENIQKMAAEQIMADMKTNEMKTNLEKEKEEFRQEQKKKYEEERQKLRKEIQDEFENFKNDQDQLQKEKEGLLKKQKDVREKEKVLTTVVEKMVNQKLSEQKAELDKKERHMDHLQKNLEKEEKLLLEEKSKLVNEIKAGIGEKTSLHKLKDLIKQQEQMLSTRQKLKQTEGSVHRRLAEEIKNQKENAMEEMEAKKKVLRDEEKRLENLRRQLNEKENTLAEKKNKTTSEMTKKYADLIAKKEKEFEEKEREWQKKMMEVNEREADFLKKQEKQLEHQKKLSKEMAEKEEETFKLMQENIAQKEKLINTGKQLTQKAALLEKDYNNKLSQAKAGYQQKVQLLGKKSDVLSDKESKLKEDEVDIMAKAEKITEESLEKLKLKQEELEKKEALLKQEAIDINQQREEMQKMRQEFEGSRNQVFQDYKDKITGIDGVINQKGKDHVGKLMDEIGIKKETKKASEMPSSGEGSVGDFGDEMELAAPPQFERMLTQDYSLSITVPPGEFLMGCDDIPESDPRHKVIIERPFRISKYPVTIIQFLQFVKETGYFTSAEKRQVCGVTVGGGDQARRDPNNKVVEFILRGPVIIDNEHANWKQPFGLKNIFEQKFNHPVTMITWWDCMVYCDWLSQKAGVKCRLPTEKEWEYVASNRGRLKPGEFYWGDEERAEKHCNSLNAFIADTTPVDKFLENKTIDGVRDMLGNVWEWTLDAYCSYSEPPDRDDDKQEYKVVRGGSYALDKEKINTFIRRPYKKMYASSCIGFRVVSEE